MNKVEMISASSSNAAEYSKRYCEYISELLGSLDHDTVSKIVDLLLQTQKRSGFVYVIGNGGSAATATHYACDLSKGTSTKSKSSYMKSLALADNFATFTAYANDVGYEHVFSGQLEKVLTSNDVVLAISASGNSPNCVNALIFAKKVQAKTISLLGFDGGKMKDLSDIALVIKTAKGEYGPVEDMHMILDHIITGYIFKTFN